MLQELGFKVELLFAQDSNERVSFSTALLGSEQWLVPTLLWYSLLYISFIYILNSSSMDATPKSFIITYINLLKINQKQIHLIKNCIPLQCLFCLGVTLPVNRSCRVMRRTVVYYCSSCSHRSSWGGWFPWHDTYFSCPCSHVIHHASGNYALLQSHLHFCFYSLWKVHLDRVCLLLCPTYTDWLTTWDLFGLRQAHGGSLWSTVVSPQSQSPEDRPVILVLVFNQPTDNMFVVHFKNENSSHKSYTMVKGLINQLLFQSDLSKRDRKDLRLLRSECSSIKQMNKWLQHDLNCDEPADLFHLILAIQTTNSFSNRQANSFSNRQAIKETKWASLIVCMEMDNWSDQCRFIWSWSQGSNRCLAIKWVDTDEFNLALPREGHLQELYHMFAYLKKYHNSEMVFDPSEPDIDESQFQEKDWTTSEFGRFTCPHKNCTSCPCWMNLPLPISFGWHPQEMPAFLHPTGCYLTVNPQYQCFVTENIWRILGNLERHSQFTLMVALKCHPLLGIPLLGQCGIIHSPSLTSSPWPELGNNATSPEWTQVWK